MRKIKIGFQISGENIDSVGMMEEWWTSQILFFAALGLVVKGKCNVQSFQNVTLIQDVEWCVPH